MYPKSRVMQATLSRSLMLQKMKFTRKGVSYGVSVIIKRHAVSYRRLRQQNQTLVAFTNRLS